MNTKQLWITYLLSRWAVILGVIALLPATALASETPCVDPDLAKVRLGVAIMLCDGTLAQGTLDPAQVPAGAPLPNPDQLRGGVTFGGVTGIALDTRRASCTEDGQDDCLVGTGFAAIAPTAIDPDKLRFGVSVAGVKGKLREMRLCRSGQGYSAIEGHATVWSGMVDTGVMMDVTAGSPAVVTQGDLDWPVRVGDSVRIDTETRIVSAVNNQTLTVTEPFTQTVSATLWHRAAAADASLTDDQDTRNNVTAYFSGAGRTNCDESNFELAQGPDAPTVDSARVPEWTHVFQDRLSGLYFSNFFYHASQDAGLTMRGALSLCESFNADNITALRWRLPTVKELLQLHVDGIALAYRTIPEFEETWCGASTSFNLVWASTTSSKSTGSGFIGRLDFAYFDLAPKMVFQSISPWSVSALCVRDPAD